MKYTFTIPGRPQVKQRPRMTRGGRVYTPQATIEYEKHVRDSYGVDAPFFTGPVAVRMKLHDDKAVVTIEEIAPPASKLRGDIDNYIKSILDGMQMDSRAFKNDRQVVRVTAAR